MIYTIGDAIEMYKACGFNHENAVSRVNADFVFILQSIVDKNVSNFEMKLEFYKPISPQKRDLMMREFISKMLEDALMARYERGKSDELKLAIERAAAAEKRIVQIKKRFSSVIGSMISLKKVDKLSIERLECFKENLDKELDKKRKSAVEYKGASKMTAEQRSEHQKAKYREKRLKEGKPMRESTLKAMREK